MCDSAEKPREHPRTLKDGKCAKCKVAEPTVSTRNISYCRPCFLQNIEYRFRTHFLKMNIPKNPRVLLAVSGGASSRCLLELFARFSKTDPANPQRLSQFPDVVVCHVDQAGLVERPYLGNHVEKLAQDYNLPYTRVSLESIFDANSLCLNDGSLTECDETKEMENLERLKHSVRHSTSMTNQEDLFYLYTMRCLYEEARRQRCNVLALGDNATLLAIRTISDTSKGRGFNLPDSIALCHSTSFGLQIIRPLKDHLAKEINLFNEFKSLEFFSHKNLTSDNDKKVSIERLTFDFITSMQDELPSTVSTITRTAFKIPSLITDASAVCLLCSGFVDSKSQFIHAGIFHEKFCTGCCTIIQGCSSIANMSPSSLLQLEE